MLALLFAPPVVFAFAMGLAGAGSKRKWTLAILAVAICQSLAIAFVVPRAEIAGGLLIAVLFPWAFVAVFVSFSPYPRRAVLVAIILPLIYAVTLAAGAIVGVNLGVVRV